MIQAPERPLHPWFDINVRKIGSEFVLHNFDWIAGDRLYHGESESDPRQRWPFRGKPDWIRYNTKKEADAAALKLQTYLVARQTAKTKKKK